MQELKEVLPYIALADNLEQSNLLLAYYLRKYSTDKAYKIYQNLKNQNNPAAQEIYPYLDGMIKKVEQMGKNLGGQIDPKANIIELLTYTEKIFLFADDQYRAGRFSPQLTQNFQTAWRFYQVIGTFASLSPDQDKRRVYAKTKAIQVHKKLKQGGNQPSFQPQQPMQQQQPIQPQSPPVPAQTFGNRKKLDPQRIAAQQNAIVEIQNAISQLSFNRSSYAKENLRKALMLLDRY